MVPKENWVTKVCFKTNGEVARNLGVSYSRNKINSFIGTMPWESIPGAVVAVETVVTPDPNAAVNPPADESSDTANPPAGQQTITGPGTYVVLDPTGSDTRKAVNGVCDGSGAGAGNIKYGTSVTIKQIFPGAGKFSYNGSQDLALTDDGRCLYVGTLLPFK